MNTRRKKGFYSISAVAKMFSVHQQTIRLYEKQGLITPKRSSGNTRLFSEEDIDRLEEVIHLTHTLGINLAGVEMILKLKKQIAKMQKNSTPDLNNENKAAMYGMMGALSGTDDLDQIVLDFLDDIYTAKKTDPNINKP